MVKVTIYFGDESGMATATHGHLREFDSTHEEWETYIEHLEQYFTANDVQDAGKQRAILLSCCGASTYRPY